MNNECICSEERARGIIEVGGHFNNCPQHKNNKAFNVSPPGHTNHMQRILRNDDKHLLTVITIGKCEACDKKNKIDEANEVKDAQYRLETSLLLRCDKCDTVIGYVKAGDLEGSYFYCQQCKEDA